VDAAYGDPVRPNRETCLTRTAALPRRVVRTHPRLWLRGVRATDRARLTPPVPVL